MIADVQAQWRKLGAWGEPATGMYAREHPGSFLHYDGPAGIWYSIGIPHVDPKGVTIHAVYVDVEHRRKGMATKLLDSLAVQFAGHAVDPGGLTPEGRPLWEKWAEQWPEVNGKWWFESMADFYEEADGEGW